MRAGGGAVHARRRRRAVAGLLALCGLVALGLVLSSGGGDRPAPAPQASAATSVVRHVTRARAASRPVAHVPRHAEPDPGSLPQTETLPSAQAAQFRELMAALWAGVVSNSVQSALPAFFPMHAYEQLKAIGSPESDWRNRLVGDYRLDIAAAHALLGSAGPSAQLIGVRAVGSYAHWVPPGACYNTVGYYEMPNARVVYRSGGAIRSFGIASMISWRGVWYVVHLGAVLRTVEAGVVDEASSGAGESAYSGTC